MKNLIFILALTLVSTANAATLSEASVLRKLSLSLKGVPPTRQEYAQLQLQPDAAAKKAFLDKMTQTYLATTQHRDRLVFQLSERFAVAPPGISATALAADPKSYEGYQSAPLIKRDAMSDLFARLTTQNLSWDALLTEKSYTLFGNSSMYTQGLTDFGFMAPLDEKIPTDNVAYYSPTITDRVTAGPNVSYGITFPADDARVGGVVTTQRFSHRYNTTGINKNRRRAAAIFKTFLCDSMVAAIGSNSDRTHDFNDVAFAENYEVTEGQIKNGLMNSANARHGSDQACAACHYKLDPLGRTFQSMGLSLAPEPSAGALVYKSSVSGKLVDIPLRGLGDLGAALTKQPEYADCQVGWFWTQYIGKDVRLTSVRRAELVRAFDSLGRRTNDFVTYLVNQPEFREKPQEPTPFITFDKVQPVLKRCDSCHSKFDDIASFSKLPFSLTGAQADHATWIADITDRMSRPEGAKGRMPKDIEMWNAGDLELIKNWISQGARDENGQPTVGVK